MQIETFHDKVDEKHRRYIDPLPTNHGYNGGLHILVPERELEQEISITIDAGAELGVSLTPGKIRKRPY